jgi:deoxyribodipyrimidine photo-lyase
VSDKTLRRDFASRAELMRYVQEQFPAVQDTQVSDTHGGRTQALILLQQINPERYSATRNFIDGMVTKLSPYIRHGVLSLAEVRDYCLQQVSDPLVAEKLVQELAWRDYWQRLYEVWGDGIWQDREPYKTGNIHYHDELPEAIIKGETGLRCMDSFRDELITTGYLHNHQRMWFAAYIVHWRQIRWQAGAHWFLKHLLDGDPASNNLSWQWVASTFSQKPYYFNRENLERFSHGQYCQSCPHYKTCIFEGSYEQLGSTLFPGTDFSQTETKKPQQNKKRWHQ